MRKKDKGIKINELYLMVFVWNLIMFWQISENTELLLIFMVGNTFITLLFANLYEKFSYKVEDIINEVFKNANKNEKKKKMR
jgi:hypothetical protein